MAATTGQKQENIKLMRKASTRFMKAMTEFGDAVREYTENLTGQIANEDFTGENEGLTLTNYTNALNSYNAVNTFITDNNHIDNIIAFINRIEVV